MMMTDAQKYPDMPDGASRALQDALQTAYAEGREAGRAAGSWAADGNTTVNHARAVLDMIADGDPAANYYLPAYPNLSGEYADSPTPASLAQEILNGIDHAPADLDIGSTNGYPPPDAVDMIAYAWEYGVSDTFLDACERELRAILPDPETDDASSPAVCGGTGDHSGQDVACCDECCPAWDAGASDAGFCARHRAPGEGSR